MTQLPDNWMKEDPAKMMTDASENKEALVLVGVLWLKVVLIALVAIAAQNSRLDLKVRVIGVEELRCRWGGRAGMEKAVGILYEDDRASDSFADLWTDNDEDLTDIPLEGCRFTVTVVDEASKLNINTVTKDQLMELPNMLEEIADAIIDWRDDDDTVSGAGVESSYYETMPYIYRIRNGPFRTIRELLLVKGVSEEYFYGEDTNFNGELDYNERDGDETPPADDGDDELDLGWIEYLTCYSYDKNKDAEGETRININSANQRQLTESLGITSSQAQWIVDNRSNGFSSIADLINNNSPQEPPAGAGGGSAAQEIDLQTFANIADKITVSDDEQTQGKVNINTASVIVLSALLGGDDAALQLAEQVVAYREEQLYGMESIAEIMELGGVSVNTFKQIADLITVRSDVYSIRSVAVAERPRSDGLTVLTEAVIDRTDSPYELLYWYQGAGH